MNTHPSLEVLLQVLTTRPVAIATNERLFSALKYLKTYLRFTTKEARVNRLALLFVHCHLNINIEHLIDQFSRKSEG